MPDADPLKNPAFRGPGFLEKILEPLFCQSRPLQCAQIEVTSHCYGRCDYCPHTTKAATWKSRHMSPEVFASLWPVLRRSRRAHLQGWGEPLLHPRFFDFAALALKAGSHVSTTSCGLVMNERLAEKLASSGMDLIAFSLAGTDARSNSARKNVDFDKVCKSIAMLRKAIDKTCRGQALEIHLAYLMLADRMEAAAALPQLMNELDVDMTVVSTLDYLASPHQKDLAFAPDDEEKIARAREILEKAALEVEKSGRILHFALPGTESVGQAGGCRENIAQSLYIDAEGQVSPCVYLNVPYDGEEQRRRVFGFTTQRNPLKIWNDEAFMAFRKKLKNGEPDSACVKCPKRFEK